MSIRSSVLLLTVCAACATAGGSQGGPNNTSSPDARAADGAVHDAPAGHDAALVPDAPIVPDAPAGSCATPFSGVLATWSLSGQPGSQASTPATSSAAGVTAASIARSAGLTAAAGTGSINASNWAPSAQLDATKYFTLSLTPPAGCTLTLTSVALDMKASSTGPASAAVATSADAFAHTATAAPNATSTPALTVVGASGAVEIRIFGYAATGTSGTMRVQNTLQVSGSLQ